MSVIGQQWRSGENVVIVGDGCVNASVMAAKKFDKWTRLSRTKV